ncbi:MAG: 2Fe-2S iron-sulfur cluster-binding protein [Nonlabens sp.]
MQDKDITITIIDRAQVAHEVAAPTDMNMNLMEVCKSYDLPVQAVCGGMAMCATCHCYIISEHNILQRNEDEEAMLWEANHVKENSRLGCQIPISMDLDGLIVELAPED